MSWIYILTSVSCVCSIAAILLLFFRKKSRGAFPAVLGVVGLLTSYVAVAIAAPRYVEPSKLGFDYLGIIVGILAALITFLVGMQLYNALRLKEDADEVSKAKSHIDTYAERIDALKKQADALSEIIDELNTKTEVIEEDIKPLYDSIMELQEKARNAVYSDPYDGPCDDK